MIGERPGLRAPDGLGLSTAPGRTDAGRNCISNIQAEGLAHDEAAARLVCLDDGAGRGLPASRLR
jgi:ethanolamine ammonia-lyase small subunit